MIAEAEIETVFKEGTREKCREVVEAEQKIRDTITDTTATTTSSTTMILLLLISLLLNNISDNNSNIDKIKKT